MGPRAGLDRRGKSHPPPGLDPRTVQPVASRYTDRATGPHNTVSTTKASVTSFRLKVAVFLKFGQLLPAASPTSAI